MRRGVATAAAVFGSVAVLAARAGGADDKTIYERLGGQPALVALVEDFVGRVASDRRVAQRFVGVDLGHFKAMLVEQLCQSTGGPCVYSGRDMRTAHAGLGITAEEYEARLSRERGVQQ